MSEFQLVLAVAALAGLLTYLGAPLAERYDAPQNVVSGAMQVAAGLITALVAFSLMPPAVRYGSPGAVVLAFFVGGSLYVFMENSATRWLGSREEAETGLASVGLYIGILADLVIDGMVIALGSTMTLATGIMLAVGLAAGTAPLAFVTVATAKRHGISPERRRILSYLFVVCMVGGAAVGYLLLRNQALEVRVVLIALASGFLLTTVTQSMIPEAIRGGLPDFGGILFIGGLSLYALTTLAL